MNYNKDDVRRTIKRQRLKLSLDQIKEFSFMITSDILNDNNYQTSQVVAIYLPINNEVDVTSLLNDSTKTFVAPKIINKEMIFVEITKDPKLVKGIYNTVEPVSNKKISEIDYLIMPTIALYQNYRLGYGGGYYDRYLSSNKIKYVVGVIYNFQLTPFNYEPHDSIVDYYFIAPKE